MPDPTWNSSDACKERKNTMLNYEDFKPLLESKTSVFGSDGEKIGTLGQIYLDDGTDLPHFATVNTGLFGSKENFVPLSDAEITKGNLYVKFTKHFVKDAPEIDPSGHLSPDDEDRLFDYYSQAGLGQSRIPDPEESVSDRRNPAGHPDPVRDSQVPRTSRIRRHDAAASARREESVPGPGPTSDPGSPGDADLQPAEDKARNAKARGEEQQLAEGPRTATEEGPEAKGPGPLHRMDP